MKISYNWLLELTGLDWPVEEVGDRLTLCGTACEEIEATDRYMDTVVVGEVLDLQPIKGADKIRLATVNIGTGSMDLVCGAPNVAVGQLVPVALEGAHMAGGLIIKKAKIRGIQSRGMICSQRELGISDAADGIMVLDTGLTPGTPVAEALDFSDYRLTFELTPNRPDSMCAIGIARDLAALAGVPLRRPQTELTENGTPADKLVSVRIQDPDACPRYAARVIRGLRMGPSPWWLQKRLLVSGMRPISNVVDITNYVMLETNQPLHAFDLDRFGSSEVVVRRARDKEKFTTLDGNEHELIPDNLMITNGTDCVAVGGVMGGLDSEVHDGTTNVLLEAAYFDPGTTRRSRRHLGLVTESSQRFEKGADPNGVETAIDRAAALLADIAGGEVAPGIVDCYPKTIAPVTIELRADRCNQVLGTQITGQKMELILNRLELEVSGDNDTLSVTVPTFRPDITAEIDLIEEVVRMEGFDAVPTATSNRGPLYTPRHRRDVLTGELRQLMTAAGFDEIIHHGLIDQAQLKHIYPDIDPVELANYSSSELNAMRTTLIPTALNVISHNAAHRNLNLAIFEIGRAYFRPEKDQKEGTEEDLVSIAVTGQTEQTWRDHPRDFDFYDIAGALEKIVTHFHLDSISFVPKAWPYFRKDISYAVKIGDREIGAIGRMSDKVVARFDIKQPVYLAEFALAPVVKEARDLFESAPLPVYPAALRDLAIVLDEGIPVGKVVDAIKKTAGQLAESVSIFDLYQGKQIARGRKSVAVAIRYRSADRSLASEEVDELQQKVIAMLKDSFKADIRDK